MNDRIVIEREALREFIDLMDTIAAETAAVLDVAAPQLARSGAEFTPTAAYRGGVKLTLGVADFPHPGRRAGETLADRIADGLNFVVSLEEGSRALGTITREVLRALDGQDMIAADELDRINGSIPASSDRRYGRLAVADYRPEGN